MREKKKFGKRTDTQRKLPNDTTIKETFGIVNSGCDSKQVANFIEKTTGHKIDMESALDRWANAEKRFQKDEECE